MRKVALLAAVGFAAAFGAGCTGSSSSTEARKDQVLQKAIDQQTEHIKPPPAGAVPGSPAIGAGQMNDAMKGMMPKQHQGKAGMPGAGAGGAPPAGGNAPAGGTP